MGQNDDPANMARISILALSAVHVIQLVTKLDFKACGEEDARQFIFSSFKQNLSFIRCSW